MIYKNLPTNWKDLERKIADIFTDVGYSDGGEEGQVLQYNKWIAKYIGVNILQ